MAIGKSAMQFSYEDAVLSERAESDSAFAVDVGDLSGLAPLLAGARARGVADAFDLMGLPALLVDQTGSVLHAGSKTLPFFGEDLAVVSRHLITASAESNRDLQALIEEAIAGRRSRSASLVVPRAQGGAIQIRALSVSEAEADDMQLLRAVIVLEELADA